MYFTFPCPRCQKNLKVREELEGRQCRCPFCGGSITISMPSAEPAAEEERSVEQSVGREQSVPAPPPLPSGRLAVQPVVSGAAPSVAVERTDVGLARGGLLGLLLSALFLAAMYPLRAFYAGQLFFDRGWVPFAEVLCFGWAVAILAQKWRMLKRQRAAMLIDLLPEELSRDITVENLHKFERHIRGLPREAVGSILVSRVLRGLEHFRVRRSAPEVATILASQSEIDADSVDSSFTLLHVFIWAIPILGFLGTVIGISGAVGQFSATLQSASDIGALKESLNGITAGLGVAFDTTLVALAMSILIMFPTSSLQKAEGDLLAWVDEYCNENFLKRLNDGREGGADRGALSGPGDLQRAIDHALAPHHAELRAWTARLEAIGKTLTDQVAEGWREINAQLEQRQQQQAGQALGIGNLLAASEEQFRALAGEAQALRSRAAAAVAESGDVLGRHFAGVAEGLRGLNSVLEKLGEQQVVVQVQAPRRRWRLFRWWSGGGSDGR